MKRDWKKKNIAHKISVEKLDIKEKYDLVMTFESVHDMPYPIEALQKIKDMVSAEGAVLIGDVSMGDKLEEKKDFAGKLYYNFSVYFVFHSPWTMQILKLQEQQ